MDRAPSPLGRAVAVLLAFGLILYCYAAWLDLTSGQTAAG